MSDKNEPKKDRKGHSDVHDAAVELGRKGGAKGGPARSAALTDAEKSKIAAMGGKAAAAKRKVLKTKLKKGKGK